MSQTRITLNQRFRTELFTWSMLAFSLALVEGGTAGVIIKSGFAGQIEKYWLDVAVAIATGAPFFANLISFIWVKLSHGRAKARFVSNVAIVFCLTCLFIGQVTISAGGLLLFLLLLILARICWSGILTVRSTIWRDNFPRYVRARVTGRLATVAALLMALSGTFAGWILDKDFSWYSLLFTSLALFSSIGAFVYRRLSVRNQARKLAEEKTTGHTVSAKEIFLVLKRNKPFARYMTAMFVLGSGNLMFMAPMIVYINEYSDLGRMAQILITSAIPLALIPLAVGRWAVFLDRNHVFQFRAVHGWFFVVAISVYLCAQIFRLESLFYIGAICYGIAIAGGVIGWNLGHNDFVGKDNPMAYMAIHVTLTGIRGFAMPLIGVTFYRLANHWFEEGGQYALMLPLLITSSGAYLFTRFNRQYQIALTQGQTVYNDSSSVGENK